MRHELTPAVRQHRQSLRQRRLNRKLDAQRWLMAQLARSLAPNRTLDLPISWSDQAGLVELQVIHVRRNRVTDHPSVRIWPQQLVRLVHAG